MFSNDLCEISCHKQSGGNYLGKMRSIHTTYLFRSIHTTGRTHPYGWPYVVSYRTFCQPAITGWSRREMGAGGGCAPSHMMQGSPRCRSSFISAKHLFRPKIIRLSFIYWGGSGSCLLYTSPSPRDATLSRMPSSA